MARPNNAAAIGAWVDGMRQAKAAFAAMPLATQERMRGATETTVREIARGAQSRLERSPSVQTRNLLNHVKWSVTKSNGRGRVGIAAGSTTIAVAGRKVRVKGIIIAGKRGGAAGGRRDIPARRAHLVEFGARHQPAEPFMIPSADAEKPHYLDRCRKAGPLIENDLRKIGMAGVSTTGGGLL